MDEKLNPIQCKEVDEPLSTTLCQLSALFLRKMPKTKARLPVVKRPKPSAFMEYVMDFRYTNPRFKKLSLSRLVEEAGKSWSLMTHDKRAPFVEKAKAFELKSMRDRERCNNHGQPLWVIEKAAREQQLKEYYVRRAIEDVVRQMGNENKLDQITLYLIKFNYFAMVTNDDGEESYIPAEVAICEFSLHSGIVRKKHMLINPGGHIYGLAYLAGTHSATTHQLPPPPNALGDANLADIYNTLLCFIGQGCRELKKLPPIYTDAADIDLVKSCLKYLNGDSPHTYLRIYPVQYMFYQLKLASVRLAGRSDPPSIFMTDLQFERDFFEYTVNIGCRLHEKMDRSRYCAKSYITRWCYIISDNVCKDLKISIIPGRHGPTSAKLSDHTDSSESDDQSTQISNKLKSQDVESKSLSSTSVTTTGTDSTLNSNMNMTKPDSYSSNIQGERPPWMNGFGRRWNTPLKNMPELRKYLKN